MLCIKKNRVSDVRHRKEPPTLTECVHALGLTTQCDGTRDIRPDFLGDGGWCTNEGSTGVNGGKALVA